MRRLLALLLLLAAGLAAYLLWQSMRPPRPTPLAERLAAQGFALGQPAYIRIFKEDSSLELWLERNGRFERALTFPVCAWSGRLGPKLKEGDGQSPEGFYLVSKRQLKPDSDYHLAFNIGFPNAFDAAQGRTGSFLMVHGACVSIGCYAMTDEGIEDIFAAVEQALANGQQAVPVHIFPFRMTDARLQAAAAEPWSDFWQNLAEGDRLVHATGRPPEAFACGTRDGFAAEGEPPPPGCTPIRPW